MVAMFARAAADSAREDDVDLAVARFGPELYGLALAITANRTDADDAYQSGWVDAIRHSDQLRVAAKRRAWLAAIFARAARRGGEATRTLVGPSRAAARGTKAGVRHGVGSDPCDRRFPVEPPSTGGRRPPLRPRVFPRRGRRDPQVRQGNGNGCSRRSHTQHQQLSTELY